MLDQEKQIEAAKEAGQPEPTFPPLLSSPNPKNITKSPDTNTPTPVSAKINVTGTDMQPSDLPPVVQAQLKKRLEGLSDKERLVEEQAIAAEIRAGEEVAGRLGKIYEKQDEERKIRKEQGRETIGDKLSSIFGGSK